MWFFTMMAGAGVETVGMMAVALLFMLFYMPTEMRTDLRDPEMCKKAKRDMRSELRWRKVIYGWLVVCVLLGGFVLVIISYLVLSIPA